MKTFTAGLIDSTFVRCTVTGAQYQLSSLHHGSQYYLLCVARVFIRARNARRQKER